tara:strand:+ start:122 stop:538 length:417 start_codon:yes stop_codon:yes gene_type:complete
MAIKLGMDGEISYATTWNGTYTPLGNVKDVTFNLETADADVTIRSNGGWRGKVTSLKEASLEFDMVWDTTDTGFDDIKDAFLGNEIVFFKVLDETGGSGLHAAFSIISFGRNETMEEAQTSSVTAKVSYDSNLTPTWI